jgi:hypothetical protein
MKYIFSVPKRDESDIERILNKIVKSGKTVSGVIVRMLKRYEREIDKQK